MQQHHRLAVPHLLGVHELAADAHEVSGRSRTADLVEGAERDAAGEQEGEQGERGETHGRGSYTRG